MVIRTYLIALATLFLLIISNTANAKENKIAIKEITICSTGQCSPANNNYSTNDLLDTFETLLKANENETVPMCDADPSERICTSQKVCHFVLGGLLPGNGCSKKLIFSEITRSDQAQELTLKTLMPLTFIGTPVKCTLAPSIVKVNSANDISLQLKAHFCSWMAVGAMTAQLMFNIDYINLDKGEIGGYWQHSVKGTGNGSGSGYLLLTYPKAITNNLVKKSNVAN